MRKLSSIIATFVAPFSGPPACAEGLIYYGTALSDQGASFKLVIKRTGNRLSFDGHCWDDQFGRQASL